MVCFVSPLRHLQFLVSRGMSKFRSKIRFLRGEIYRVIGDCEKAILPSPDMWRGGTTTGEGKWEELWKPPPYRPNFIYLEISGPILHRKWKSVEKNVFYVPNLFFETVLFVIEEDSARSNCYSGWNHKNKNLFGGELLKFDMQTDGPYYFLQSQAL